MANPILLQIAALILVTSGVFAAYWALYSRKVRVRSRADQSKVRKLMKGNEGFRQFAILYLQLEGLVVEGALKKGINTRKMGGLFKEPIPIDTWSLMLEFLREEHVRFKTYTTFLSCRRLWVRLLAGHVEIIDELALKRCQWVVDQLVIQLDLTADAADERVAERLATAAAVAA